MEVVTSIDTMTEKIIGCAIAVHRALGPGLLESIYRDCLEIELKANNLRTERERRVTVRYRGQRVRDDLKLDFLVEDLVVIEVRRCRAFTRSILHKLLPI